MFREGSSGESKGSKGSDADLYTQSEEWESSEEPKTRSRVETIEQPTGKVGRDEMLHVMSNIYSWIIFNHSDELGPLVDNIIKMLTSEHFLGLPHKTLGTALINAVIKHVLKPGASEKISEEEKVILASFLLAPLYALSDPKEIDEQLEALDDFIEMQTERRLGRSIFMFVKYCLICPNKETLIEELVEKGIVLDPELLKIIDDFYGGSQGKSVVYNSLVRMFETLHNKRKMLEFYSGISKEESAGLLKLNDDVHRFLNVVTNPYKESEPYKK